MGGGGGKRDGDIFCAAFLLSRFIQSGNGEEGRNVSQGGIRTCRLAACFCIALVAFQMGRQWRTIYYASTVAAAAVQYSCRLSSTSKLQLTFSKKEKNSQLTTMTLRDSAEASQNILGAS
jgi:hypothetical protein